ncbi:hypothetical protein VTN31DRAFT_252 [Thermomyces dupontii]|uniref:uncharacterized protein n=1 Tax=Talaromyces thermophilus TaxID=28565 RepID=UPI003743CE83
MVQIGMRVPGSFSERLRCRSEIRGMFVRYGMPWIWLTVNPSDLRDPLVLKLAGEDVSPSMSASDLSRLRQKVALPNPVVVAEFFGRMCKAVLDGQLQGNNRSTGVLGDVSNHYGVVDPMVAACCTSIVWYGFAPVLVLGTSDACKLLPSEAMRSSRVCRCFVVAMPLRYWDILGPGIRPRIFLDPSFANKLSELSNMS